MEYAASDNIPITVEGFVTDPKRIGFQVLTNYENMFWRALVGSNPWGLYEVLRGYCHGESRSCHPSIATLMAILGVKDRRSLTGYAQRKNGKKYLGWIEVLQTYELVIAEVQGEGHSLHYLFHVNLTPQLLTDKQLATLPDVLQQKHQELLEKCEHQLERLRSRRKPAKTVCEASQSVSKEAKEGLGKSHAPPGKIPSTPGIIPPKQQPNNNTHKQTTTSTAVADLEKWKIPPTVARQLVDEFGSQHVVEKLDYLSFKLNDQKERVKNPAGWLRIAIKQDWAAPVGYKTPEQKRAEQQQAQAQAEQQQRAVMIDQQKRAQQSSQNTELLAKLSEKYHTPPQLTQLWSEQILQTLQNKLTAGQYACLANSALLALTQKKAVLGIPQVFTIRLIERQSAIQEAIKSAVASHTTHRLDSVELISFPSAEE